MYFHKAQKSGNGYYFELCPDQPCQHPDTSQHHIYRWTATDMTAARIVAEIRLLERSTPETHTTLAIQGKAV